MSGTVTADYDNDFRVAALSVNGNPFAFFDYDQDGLLVNAGDLGIHRDGLNGRIDSTFLGTVTTGETYDQFGQWATRTARAGATELYRSAYTRDALGRIAGLLEVVEGEHQDADHRSPTDGKPIHDSRACRWGSDPTRNHT